MTDLIDKFNTLIKNDNPYSYKAKVINATIKHVKICIDNNLSVSDNECIKKIYINSIRHLGEKNEVTQLLSTITILKNDFDINKNIIYENDFDSVKFTKYKYYLKVLLLWFLIIIICIILFIFLVSFHRSKFKLSKHHFK